MGRDCVLSKSKNINKIIVLISECAMSWDAKSFFENLNTKTLVRNNWKMKG